MEFRYKTLQYQTDAVESIVDIFNGQEKSQGFEYRYDLGSEKSAQTIIDPETGIPQLDINTAYCNKDISLTDKEILDNIKNVQKHNGLPQSDELRKSLGRVTLDIDMETGTGKTYVYTKAVFELNAHYGWSKFIIIVPNIAVREGVYKSIKNTESHFMEQYHSKIRVFIYDSSNLNKIDDFSRSPGINLMIINSQAFATSFRDDGNNEQSRVIYSVRDEFASRRPIDIIAASHPILILDEPQKLGSYESKTQTALRKHFNALFSMNFSATHAAHHNQIYSLDALDAYNQKLVKKICVKGIQINNMTGSNPYAYLERIDPGKTSPTARMEIYVNLSGKMDRKTVSINYQDNLYESSNHVEAYRGIFITNIDGINNTVSLSNGTVIHSGEAIGEDLDETAKRRIQIRETILSHLDIESKLFKYGIKVLSLFFLDKVSNYRVYDEEGEHLGDYGRIFEEELRKILKERDKFYDSDYISYLKKFSIENLHAGYFSIDKKGHMIDSKISRGSRESSDVSAYDLIMKNKELLLSESNPVRFIFSHSALSEGWDNPNVFQICALKHSDSNIRRRQEVGRGMRICVNQSGDRQDFETLGPQFHDFNKLTVIADEDYETFVKGLQEETTLSIRHRAMPIDENFLRGKKIETVNGTIILDSMDARRLSAYLIYSSYVDIDYLPTDKLSEDLIDNNLAPLPNELKKIESGLVPFLKEISSADTVEKIVDNGFKSRVQNNLNSNFEKKEFLELWSRINHQYHYMVSFDSKELIGTSIKHINEELNVSSRTFTVTMGEQKDKLDYLDARNRTDFKNTTTKTETASASESSSVKYDLIGRITSETGLTRRTISKILIGIDDRKFSMFKLNPEEFIKKTSRLINEEKSTVIVNHVEYKLDDGKFDSNIFTMNKPEGDFAKAYRAKKNVQDYIFTDSEVEKKFAGDLDGAEEVVVYAKLPDGKNGFFIPTPMGNYSPDWAIAFDKERVRHVYFVAETKGSMSSLNLDKIEESKIQCASKLFSSFYPEVKFRKISTYAELRGLVMGDQTDD